MGKIFGIENFKDTAEAGANMDALSKAAGSNLWSNFARSVDVNRNTVDLYIKAALCAQAVLAASPTAYDKTFAELMLKQSAEKLLDIARGGLHTVHGLEKMLNKDGELHGVESAEVIINTVASFFATQNAERSAFNRWDRDDNDNYRFNTQQVAAKEQGLPGVIKYTGPDKKKYDIHSARSALIVDIEQNDGSYTQLPIADAYFAEADVNDRSWPSRKYSGKEIAGTRRGIREELTKSSVLSNPKRKHRFNSQTGAKLLEIDRLSLHQRITDRIPEVIKKHGFSVMTETSGREPETDYVNISSTVQVCTNPKPIDVNHELVSDVQAKAADYVESTPVHAAPNGGLTLGHQPDKAKLKVENGNFYCPRCGQTGFKKNNLNTFTPVKLPDGMPDDHESLADTSMWVKSYVCPACMKELKELRDKATGAFVREIRASGDTPSKLKISAALEVGAAAATNLVQELTQAMTELATEEAKLSALEAGAKAMKDVPEALSTMLEEQRFNTQQVRDKVEAINVLKKQETAKYTAIANGTARIISKPEAPVKRQEVAASQEPVKLSRKQKKASMKRRV